jgi:hypothetical protein
VWVPEILGHVSTLTIDALTHWSVDHALGESRAVKLPDDATPDVALAWVREWHRAPSRTIQRGAIRLR